MKLMSAILVTLEEILKKLGRSTGGKAKFLRIPVALTEDL